MSSTNLRGPCLQVLLRGFHFHLLRGDTYAKSNVLNQIFIVDRVAKPKIARGENDAWSKNMHVLSERPNVYCKISGMVTEANWSAWTETDLQLYFENVLSSFGASRPMFGSDWPVLTLASSYERWIALVARMLQLLTDSEANEITHGTAEKAYDLSAQETVLRFT